MVNIKESNISPNVINSNRLYQMYWKKKQFSQNTDKLLIFLFSLSFLEGIMRHAWHYDQICKKKKTFKTPRNRRHHFKENKQPKPPASPLKTPEILPTEVVDARVKPLGAKVGASVAHTNM